MKTLKLAALAGAALLLSGLPAFAQSALPDETKAMLKALKFDESILSGVDKEMELPAGWLEGAKKEGVVSIYTTMEQKDWQKAEKVFRARYPDIKVEHTEVRTTTQRTLRPLVAFKEGRSTVDVITGLSGNSFLFRDAGAFIDLNDLPNYRNNIPDELKVNDNITAIFRVRYWCIAYNTNKIKAADLPKTWDDMVANPKVFGNKKLGIGNRPNNWLSNLYTINGEDWGRKYMDDLFKLNPQLRKEGLSALLSLVAAGEMDATIPAAMDRVAQIRQTGAPVAHHCPEPVPFAVSELGVMKNSAHINAAKILTNWLMSKEGQVALFYANDATPAHKGLQGKEFVAFPEQVEGKKKAIAEDRDGAEEDALLKYWEALWLKGGGQK
ncbi:MAG TPA: ABC transporter substrate-binding protein [Alphaproteobacteria bacterium]|nr:ABC transporter substrate-binding protein [Alphaproteobacteria bacterium]